MNNNKRGYVLSFLNEFAGTKNKLRCLDSEKTSLNICLSNLGFRVVLLGNLTKQQTIDELNKYMQKKISQIKIAFFVYSHLMVMKQVLCQMMAN